MSKIEVQIEKIDKDVLVKIAQDLLLGEEKESRRKQISETVEKAPKPTLDEMKEDLSVYQAIVHTLVEKIKEEEKRREKEENHVIAGKIRTTHIKDQMIFKSKLGDSTIKEEDMTNTERLIYNRRGNKTICTIHTDLGIFEGECTLCPGDKYNYDNGMTLAMLRARENMYKSLADRVAKEL